jgi:DNA-binding NtrC family response regulator
MKKALTILIIDDDDFFTASLSDFLANQGYIVKSASNARDGLTSFENLQPPIVLLDQKLPDARGIDVCRNLLEINRNTKVIFITAYATVQYAVEAMQAGAFDYLSKPFELEELLIDIERAVKNVTLEGKLRIQNYEREKERKGKKLIGSSQVMLRTREQMALAAGSEANVLITGETGVGKNVVAEGIHNMQNMRETFLAINCSAIPENLMEAEYFGHEKGVFTGADARREGIFELADGGTLLLDEIGEIPMHLQSKLLSVLEDKCIRRIGSGRTIPVDVRIIATTNRNLEEAIRQKRFRQDLYYRLAVFNVHIPPLRHHPEDIPEITSYFVERFNRAGAVIPDNHLEKMCRYPWPGNVRELRNVVERASILKKGNAIRPADLLLNGHPDPSGENFVKGNLPPQDIQPLETLINEHIARTLRLCGGNKSRAARLLGISLSTLKRKLKQINRL